MTPVDLTIDDATAVGSGQPVLVASDGGSVVARTVLPSGVRVLTESMPGLRSATVGMWVGVGSRDEADGHHGSTHFLEHLLFKGTERRSPLEIAEAFDAVGGEANAATGKEHTCYYARVMAGDAPMAIDVITDMVTSSRIGAEDFESEREVILEELAMAEDDPSDVVHERFAEAVLADHPLGRPIGGTPETIKGVGRDDVVDHYRRHYEGPTLVITAAGGLEHDEVVEAVSAELDKAGWLDRVGTPRHLRGTDSVREATASGRDVVVRRDIEQAQVVVGTTALSATDERRYVLSVLNTALGGGMSSRLFQEVREKRGLAYSVYSFSASYADGGYMGLYAGCNPAKVDKVVDLLGAEWERLAADGLDPGELERAVGQLSGGMTLGLEDSGSRMSRLGKAELVHRAYTDLDETLLRLRAVTAEQVQDLAAELASRPRSLAVVGPFDADRGFGTAGR
ncbi:M16 family metallopeptidase [Aquipuribacter sp. MA13-6]|uniref:M16 family metallopeptidase n=1 Tax=unclassified Aquipuribacter TaxID=2635084 RepID=UPI003EEC3C4D